MSTLAMDMRERLTSENGTYRPAFEWASICNMSTNGLYKALKRHPEWTINNILNRDINKYVDLNKQREKKVFYKGRYYSRHHICQKAGISEETLRTKMVSGEDLEAFLEKKVKTRKERETKKQISKEKTEADETARRQSVSKLLTFCEEHGLKSSPDTFLWHGVPFPKNTYEEIVGLSGTELTFYHLPDKDRNKEADRLLRKRFYRNVEGMGWTNVRKLSLFLNIPEEELLSMGKGKVRVLVNNARKKTKYITYKGETKSLLSWAKELGMNPKTLRNRFKRGWSVERALSTPIGKYIRPIYFEYKGQRKTILEWSKEVNIPRDIIYYRIFMGMDPNLVLTMPYKYRGRRKGSKLYTCFERRHTLYEWAMISGISKSTLQSRLVRGMSMEEALTYHHR